MASVIAWRAAQQVKTSKLLLAAQLFNQYDNVVLFLDLLFGPHLETSGTIASADMLERILDSMPIYYQFSRVINAVENAVVLRLGDAQATNEDLKKQFNIDTATWGLPFWERQEGLEIIPDDDDEVRRGRVKARLRGIGNYSAPLLKSIVSSWLDCECEVTVDIPHYNIVITFTGTRGIPAKIQDVENALNDVIHAHIGHELRYTYLIWNELDHQALTWDALDAKNWSWDVFEVWRPEIP
jgi:hypothetical protein